MKKYLTNYVMLAFGMLFLTACSTTPPSIQTGPNAEVSFDGLTKVDNTLFDHVWIRSDIDLSSYNKVIFETTEISYRPVRASGGFPLSNAQKTQLARELSNAFENRLSSSNVFELVTNSGPGVLLLRAKLQDVVSNVPPQSMGRTEIYLTEVGRATLVLELYDSNSNTILARAVDRQAVGNRGIMESNSVRTWQEVRQVGNRWASITRNGLEALIQGTAFN